MNKYSFFIVFFLFTFACKEDLTYEEMLSIYTTKQDQKGYVKDSLIYQESILYQGDKKVLTTYFDSKSRKYGFESFIYDNRGAIIQADYKDSKDSILSYYKYICDSKGKQISSTAFDASNDQPLRTENYEYDFNNKLKVKEIFNTENILQRRYTFENDSNGLPNTMYVTDHQGDTIATEVYKYTKYDDKKRWTEKWGFVNDIPKTYYQRSFNHNK
jgi:hypothetical protein